MKIEFDLKTLPALPEKWTTPSEWPGKGVYIVDTEADTLYIVGGYSVAYLPGSVELGRKIESATGNAVPELLVLKLIAAASRAETLRGV